MAYSPTITVQPTRRGSFVTRTLKSAVVLAMVLLVFNDILGGVIKYYTATNSLIFVSFIPTLFAGAVLGIYILAHALVMRIHVKTGMFLLIFFLNALYALAIGRTPAAVGFAFYIWLPFFVGLLLSTFRLQHHFEKYVMLWWLIATAGVLINSQIKFPWIGENYQVFGQTLQAAREWTALGIDRLAGFSRASFAASNQIALFCMVMLTMKINILKKIVVWILSSIAIYLTTSKITLLLMVIGPLLIGTVGYLNRHSSTTAPPTKFIQRICIITLWILSGIMVLMPVLTLTSKSSVGLSKAVGFLTLDSLYDRMAQMWPQAWDLIFSQGNLLLMLFGRGMGGIGVPMNLSEALRHNSADNLFVYLYVSFGILSAFFVYQVVASMKKWATGSYRNYLTYFALSCAMIIIGTTSSVVESGMCCFTLGMLVGKMGDRPKQLIQAPVKPLP